MKTFDNEWILDTFEGRPGFFTRRMFGGLAVYPFGRQMMVLVEPTRTGRWKWHGVLICTEHRHQRALIEEFPQLAPHGVLKKWLYIDSRAEDFESTMERVAETIARDDKRFGILPRLGQEKIGTEKPGKERGKKTALSGGPRRKQ
jgi:hypothetical protein